MTSAVKVAVIFGGRSTEHDVSCKSAASVLQYLDRTRYDVLPIRIGRDGVWVVGEDRPAAAVDVSAARTTVVAAPPRPGVNVAIEAIAYINEPE